MRALLVALASLMLSACNVVMSEEPLFTDADAKRAPPFRDGAWVSMTAECQAQWHAPKAAPPPCAEHGEVRGGRLVPPDDPAQSVIVAGGGEPLIVQVQFTPEEASTGEPFRIHIFGALKPTRRDDQGRIVEARRWLVLCGEPPPGAGQDSLRREEHLTKKLLPGLILDKELGICRARTAAVVRNAARASEAWDVEKAVVRWVSDPAP
ncbi:hypothetical protein [Phenylobacterium sp.]|jgi:hypothetical protein|uniref:hypothetical protein n=1 Tax=Phenylobacterium sp. TaxID=1871053 RepID=UPI002E312063|nr:hypothetical protein [Phenylobacterium sp.]HEX2559095.1 hypothetical protein [Phenylobacterium sp.]